MKNLGSASMQINLTDNKIKVYHGTSKDLLFQKEAKEKDWDNIWDAIEGKNKINEEAKEILCYLLRLSKINHNDEIHKQLKKLKKQLNK